MSKRERLEAQPSNVPVVATAGDSHPNLRLTSEALRFMLSQVSGKRTQDSVTPSPNLKYAFEFFKLGSELMSIFGNLQPEPFTSKTVEDAPTFGGLYLLFRARTLVYVGISDRLRRRLGEHLRGNSNFAIAVKKKYKLNEFRKCLADNFEVHCQEFEDMGYRQQLEHVIIGVYRPSFNLL